MPGPMHLVVGTPCYGGQVTVPYFTSLLRLRDHCAGRGVRLSFAMPWGDALVTRARNDIAAHFLEDPAATHLLFIDADIAFGVEAVDRLLQSGREFCAGIYPLKKYDWDQVARAARAGEGHLGSAGLSYVNELGENHRTVDGFAQLPRVGTGFLLLQRKVFEALAQKHPELRYQAPGPQGPVQRTAFFQCLIDERGHYLSEDYSFCKRWTDLGGEIWADFNSRLGHVGPHLFQGDVARLFNPAPPGEGRP